MQDTFDCIQNKSNLFEFGITSVLPSEAHKKRKNTVFAHRISACQQTKEFQYFYKCQCMDCELTMFENKTRKIR